MVTNTKTTEKQADIRARAAVKNLTDVAVWLVKGSDGLTDYHVTVVRGIVSNCDCPAHGFGHITCYIKRGVQLAENDYRARQAAAAETALVEQLAETPVQSGARHAAAYERMMSAPLNGNRDFSLTR